MGDGDAFSNYRFAVGHDVYDHIILDTAALTHDNSTEIAAQYRPEPDVGSFFDNHIADYGSGRRNKYTGADARFFTCIVDNQ